MKDKEKPQPDEWARKVDEYLQAGEDWAVKKQIMINWNYYVGNQWIGWNRASRQVVEAPKAPGEERITHNKIRSRVMTKISKQTKNRIKYDVMPDTNSQERIEIAKAATKFVKFWWQEEQMDRKTRDIFLNNAVKGYCAAKVYFDPDQGDDITPSKDEPGYEEGKTIRMGNIVCRICDPLTLYIDPASTTDDEIRWIAEEKPRDVDYVKQKYGKDVPVDDNVSYLTGYDINATGIGDNQQQKKTKNMVMVRELWIKPCHQYPNGLKVTATRTDVLDVDENAGDLPYFIFGDIPVPGTVKYDAFIKDMLPVQREINIIRTMFASHAKKMGNSVWLKPIGAEVEDDELTNEESAIIEYVPIGGAKPERVAPNDLPSFYDRILEYGERDIDDMSGAREIAQGRLPAGLDTASGLALMVEQENEKLAISSQNYEQGMKRLLTRVLQLMRKHYTEERLGRILGPDNEVELVAFTGSDLSGGEDINIVQGSSLPEMRSAQEERIITLWREGAIVRKDGTPDVDSFLRLMGMGDSTELFEQHQLDENKSKMENKIFGEMAENPQLLQVFMQYQQQKADVELYNQTIEMEAENQGVMPDAVQKMLRPMPPVPKGMPHVRDFQDHEIHIYQHNAFRKSQAYDDLSPEIQAMVDAHVAEHEAMLQAPMMAQMQMQQQQMQMQAEEQDKAHERQMEMKQMDHRNNVQRDVIKGQQALQQAALRTPGRG